MFYLVDMKGKIEVKSKNYDTLVSLQDEKFETKLFIVSKSDLDGMFGKEVSDKKSEECV